MKSDQDKFSFFDHAVDQGWANRVVESDYDVFWNGFIYVAGFPAGEPSIREFIRRLRSEPLESLTQSLCGAFLIVVRDQSHVTRCFTDDSGMMAAFYSNRGVSQSYLNMLELLSLRSGQVDLASVALFLQTGFTSLGNTHFTQVRKVGGNEILEFTPGKSVVVREKISIEITADVPRDSSILGAFEDLRTAVSGMKISVDVTGGVDTRTLIALLVGSGVDFETSSSGTADHPDVILGREVAQAVGKDFYPSIHDSSDFEERLEDTIFSLDGLKSYISAQHRLNQMQSSRRRRGIDLSLKGLGGELFRDGVWPKDYSWLLPTSANIRKTYLTHIEGNQQLSERFMTTTFKRVSQMARQERVKHLEDRFKLRSKTQTYDCLYQCAALQSSESYALSVASMRSMPCHAPLAEVSRLRYPFHTPRLKRVGGYYQRKIISGVNPALANVMSTYGSVLSADVGVLFSSSVRYLTNKVKQRITRDYSELTRARGGAPSQADCQRMLINSPLTAKAMSRLVDADVIRSDVSPHDIPYELLERCVSVGWLLDYADEIGARP